MLKFPSNPYSLQTQGSQSPHYFLFLHTEATSVFSQQNTPDHGTCVETLFEILIISIVTGNLIGHKN